MGIAAIVVAALVVSRPDGEDVPAPNNVAETTSGAGAAAGPPGTQAAALGDGWVRAVHIGSYEPDALAKPAFVDALRRAKADGATHIVLQPLLGTNATESARLTVRDDTPSDTTLAGGIQAADREGLKTVIQPTVEPEGDYAGDYAPDDPGAFFDAYEDRIATYAQIARAHGADGIVVGTMLSQLDGPHYTDRWTTILNDTRERCGCQVTYAAWFAGIDWYELNGDGAQPEPDDYSFAGKKAEEVMRAWHSAT